MNDMDSLFSHGGLPPFFSESLSDIADAGQHASRKRSWYESCCEILDDTSALHEWPVPAKRARCCDGQNNALQRSNSLNSHAFSQKNATPSVSILSPFFPARPRANAMHDIDDGGVGAGDVAPPSRDTSQRPSTSLFVRFAELASCNGITPLHLPSPDKFPTIMQMETLVRAITVA